MGLESWTSEVGLRVLYTIYNNNVAVTITPTSNPGYRRSHGSSQEVDERRTMEVMLVSGSAKFNGDAMRSVRLNRERTCWNMRRGRW